MWTLLMLSGLTNWATRWCVPSLVPFVASALELDELQRAFLLSSFFPGCESCAACEFLPEGASTQ